MYTFSHKVLSVPVAKYIAEYRDADRFIAYCKECKRYDRCWSCPPFHFDTLEYISAYKTAFIIGTKIVPDVSAKTEFLQSKKAGYQIIKEVRSVLDPRLLNMETLLFGSRAFFAGTCYICPAEKCERIFGRPCIAPGRMRPTLEAFGFDIEKTTSQLLGMEMKWGKNGVLPEYLILVSGFFTNQNIARSEIYKLIVRD